MFSTTDRFIFGGICAAFIGFAAIAAYMYFSVKNRAPKELLVLEDGEMGDGTQSIQSDASSDTLKRSLESVIHAPVKKISFCHRQTLQMQLESQHSPARTFIPSPCSDSHVSCASKNGTATKVNHKRGSVPVILVTQPL